MNDLVPQSHSYILYSTSSGEVTLSVLLNNETIWLTQKMIAE